MREPEEWAFYALLAAMGIIAFTVLCIAIASLPDFIRHLS